MAEEIVPREPRGGADAEREEAEEDGLVLGRPIEDRSFEAVEAGAGMMAGMLVGTAVAGPIGTAVGAVVGAAAGLAAGEVLERHEGRAARSTDATDD